MSFRIHLAVLGIALLAGCATVSKPAAPLALANNGTAAARIVVASDAPPSTQYAAQELQRYLGEMTGAQFAIVPDTEPVENHEIIVGCNRHLTSATRNKKLYESLGNESYVIESTGSHVIIAGGEPRGTLYGVYGLLEDHLGCRWFTPQVSTIPKKPSLSLPVMSQVVTPVLEYREPFVADCFDGDWAARNRMNSSSARLEEKHGGKVSYFGFVHTFDGLLPPAQYFEQHPEYYSLIDGKRTAERSQLCCTNEDVIRIVTEEVRKRMREHPEATVFSVSQNDWYNYCQCDKCTALAESEGSQIAPVLQLVNRVADAVAKEFPDKLIDTLAYQYTRKPPKTMRAAPNVIIRLCSIECCFAHSFEECDSPENKTFVADVEEWGKICNRLWVWNYNTSFSNYFMPYPNLRVRNDNIQFYVRNNVKGIFEQDVYTTLGGELSGLSGYLNAKMLWNPQYDEDTAINEFIGAVYGNAAPLIREYIDLIHNRAEAENIHMDIWIGPEHPLLDHGVLELANHIFDVAEQRVADQPEVLERVRVARLSVDFATIERMRAQGLGIYQVNHVQNTLVLRPDFATRVQRFFEVAERNGVTSLREANGDLGAYKQELSAYKEIQAGPMRSAQNVAKPAEGLVLSVYEGAFNALPDFKTLTPAETNVVNEISLNVTKPRDAFALSFDGYFYAPADGIYVFNVVSNDGSKVYIDGEAVIDHDGLHKLSGKSGIASLKKGFHAFRVEYFESGGAEGLQLLVEGPGINNGPVGSGLLWHE